MMLLATALFLGFLHGLGPDHLMAIATLSAGHRRVMGVAVRFALGHALLLGIGAGLIVLIGWTIPPGIERGGEMLGGALLIVMGIVTLQHLRRHSETPHRHHSHLPTMIGAAFAVSSLRALAMLTPFGSRLGTAPLPLLLALIVVFAGGILASMVLFGVVLARVLSMRTLERVGHGAGALIGASSVLLGVAWVMTA
jgi:nickel/cobalt exporter